MQGAGLTWAALAGACAVLVAAPAFATCEADFDGSCDVGFSDLSRLLSQWGPCDGCPEDLDSSGDVGFSDLTEVLNTWGPCSPEPCELAIDDFTPVTGGVGDLITITGCGFGNDPDDLCVALELDGRLIGLEPIAVCFTRIVAVLPVIPPDAEGLDHLLHVIVANGDRVDLGTIGTIEVPPGQWIWSFDGEPVTTSNNYFQPIIDIPTTTKNYHSGPPQDGKLIVTIDEPWDPGVVVNISGRIRKTGSGKDTQIENLILTAGGNPGECASELCPVIQAAFAASPTSVDPLVINCDVVAVGPGVVEMRISCQDGSTIESGNLDILTDALVVPE